MNSNFCGKCGASNAGQNKFCLQCGLNLENANQPANSYAQPAVFQQGTPNYAPQQNYAAPNPFQPQANNSAPFQPNYAAPNNFPPPTNNNFQSSPAPLSQTVASQRTGIGGKLFSIFGTLLVGLFLLLKFGVIFLRLGRLGGGLLIAVAVAIIVIVLVAKLVKKLIQ